MPLLSGAHLHGGRTAPRRPGDSVRGFGTRAPSQSFGAVIPPGDPVPPTPLIDQNGRPVTLQSFRGKYVVLAQFLTLCQDECPITTGAFQDMQQAVQQAGLGGQVAFVEATVDPGRDTPARLRAYQSEFGADWTLLDRHPGPHRRPLEALRHLLPEGARG